MRCYRGTIVLFRLYDDGVRLIYRMKREDVESSNLQSVGYDLKKRLMEVEFHGGRVYQYFGVPARLFWGLMDADSLGKYFHRNIRMAFEYERLA